MMMMVIVMYSMMIRMMMMVIVVTKSRSIMRSMGRMEVQSLWIHNGHLLLGMERGSAMLVNIIDMTRSVGRRSINVNGHFVMMMNMVRMRLNPSWWWLGNWHPLLQLNWSPDFLPVCDIDCLRGP